MSAHLAIKSGNLAIITGGASGIGLAAAKYFARNGMHVVISDIDEPLLGDASAAISKESPNAKVYATKVDVSNVESVQNLRRSVLRCVTERMAHQVLVKSILGSRRGCLAQSKEGLPCSL